MDSVSRERVYKSQQNKIEIYVNTTRQFNVRHIIGLKTTHWQLCYRNIYHVIVCLSVENTYMDIEFKTLLLSFGIYRGILYYSSRIKLSLSNYNESDQCSHSEHFNFKIWSFNNKPELNKTKLTLSIPKKTPSFTKMLEDKKSKVTSHYQP